jgi:uncharacterized membrane protein
VFLAGTSAFLSERGRGDVSRVLVLRGLWLVLLELTVLRVAWTFNFDFAAYEMAGVIWVIGWSMILLAALRHLPAGVVGMIGVAVIASHNLMDGRMEALARDLGDGLGAALWKIAYVGFFAGPISLGPDGPTLVVLYTLVPWAAVMAAGYGFGKVLAQEPADRNRLCLAIGLGAVALFLVLRGFNLYGDPRPWAAPSLFSFLNTSKYPASLLFLLMTLGPAVALIPVLEKVRGPVADVLTLFGRVPFFFYLLHIPLIHAMALVVSKVRLGEVSPWLFANHPMGNPPAPEGYAWGLGLLYLVWAAAVFLLYFPCRWFAAVKARSSGAWRSYL